MKKSTQETANKLENRLNEKVASLDRKIETKINNLEKSIANILEIQKQILKNQEIEFKSDFVSHTGMINNS